MYLVIGLMFSGIFIGYILRNKNLRFINKVIIALIWILLFLLGIDVGNNQEIINGLFTIGVEALIVSVAAVLGSVIGAMLLWKWISGKSSEKSEL